MEEEGNLTFRGNSDAPEEAKQEHLQPKIEGNVFAEKVSLTPNLNEGDESESLLEFTKDNKYYQDLDITMDDLEQMEGRIEELERYLGIEH